MNRYLILILAIFLISMAPICSSAAAPLSSPIPDSAYSLLVKAYSKHHVVGADDLESPDEKEFFKNGFPKSPGVASCDFNGDGIPDYAVLLRKDGTKRNILVVAISTETSWRLDVLENYFECKGNFYFIETVPPGEYQSLLEESELTHELKKKGHVSR